MANDIELKEFVTNTLVEIALDVRDANKNLHDEHEGDYSNSPYRLHNNLSDNEKMPGLSFDVAVTASEGAKGNARNKGH